MAAATKDPVGALVDSHGRLSVLAREVGQMLQRKARPTARARNTLKARLEVLRDELLEHFANEEEALFPFIRANVPSKIEAVDRLESAHDTICGAIVRLTHLAAQGRATTDDGSTLYGRFEAAYATHSRQETELFDELGRFLSNPQQLSLAALLEGLR